MKISFRMQRYIFDSDPDRNNIKVTTTVWYSGAQSIQEVPTMDMTKTKTSKSPKIEVKYYLFIDSASNKHLYFMNFSDTAKFVAKSGNSDLFSKYGGWNLYSKAEFEHDKMERMADTIIDGKRLSRYNLFKARGKDHLFNFIVYGSCFEKNLRILYLPSIAKRIG